MRVYNYLIDLWVCLDLLFLFFPISAPFFKWEDWCCSTFGSREVEKITPFKEDIDEDVIVIFFFFKLLA